MMNHEAGRQQINTRLVSLVDHINGIRTGSNNLQIAIATFYLNLAVMQTLSLANCEKCRIITEGLLELLKWSKDLEANYRAMQALGQLTSTCYSQEVAALFVSVDYVVDRLRELTAAQHPPAFGKINDVGKLLFEAIAK